jgi:hypothetical protein
MLKFSQLKKKGEKEKGKKKKKVEPVKEESFVCLGSIP